MSEFYRGNPEENPSEKEGVRRMLENKYPDFEQGIVAKINEHLGETLGSEEKKRILDYISSFDSDAVEWAPFLGSELLQRLFEPQEYHESLLIGEEKEVEIFEELYFAMGEEEQCSIESAGGTEVFPEIFFKEKVLRLRAMYCLAINTGKASGNLVKELSAIFLNNIITKLESVYGHNDVQVARATAEIDRTAVVALFDRATQRFDDTDDDNLDSSTASLFEEAVAPAAKEGKSPMPTDEQSRVKEINFLTEFNEFRQGLRDDAVINRERRYAERRKEEREIARKLHEFLELKEGTVTDVFLRILAPDQAPYFPGIMTKNEVSGAN